MESTPSFKVGLRPSLRQLRSPLSPSIRRWGRYSRAMSVPQVVIVCRPNVGKSSLFNWLAGRRLAIVDDRAGVTRDRVTHLIEADDRFFELVDTGGIGLDSQDELTEHVEH